ncbi:hypothetical protein AVEN_74833-1, partial [Araneus ventricosus]
MEGRLATTHYLACSRPHTRRIFSGIGFEPEILQPPNRDLTTRPPRPQAKVPRKPGDPKIAGVKGDCLLLKWRRPQNARKTQVKGYIIETWDNEKQSWTQHTKTTKNVATLCDVIGKESQLRVRAFNDKGISMPSKKVFVGEFANTEDYPSDEENVGKDYPSDKVT